MAATGTAWIRIGAHGLDWARKGAGDTVDATGHAPDWDALPFEAGTRAVLVVPGARVRVHHVDLPPGPARRLRAALPFALEERLPGAPEDYHLVPLPRGGKGRSLPVAVVEHAAMDQWLGPARAAGLRPLMLVPDFFCLPEPVAGTWRVMAGETALLVRQDGAAGLTVPGSDGERLPAGLVLALEGAAEPPATLELVVPDGETRRGLQGWVAQLQGLGVTVQVQEMGGDAGRWLLGQPRPPQALNLLTGPYASREDPRLWLKRAGPAAGLAAALLLAAGVESALELRQVRAEHTALEERIRATYREAFPDANNLVDPRFQMEQRLERLRAAAREGGGPEGLLTRLAAAGPALEGGPELEVHRVHFEGGRLEITATLADFEALEALKGRLSDTGAEVAKAELEGDRVRARLLIGEGGS